MFDLYTYFKESLPCSVDQYICDVYASTGLAAMEGVLDNARNPAKACILVDVGSDGSIDFVDCESVKFQQSFFVLERSARQSNSATQIAEILSRTRSVGLGLARTLAERSCSFDFDGYGLDRSNIAFYSVGPIAGYYGYAFSLTFTTDN